MNVLARERVFFVSLVSFVPLAASLTLSACDLFGSKEEKEDLAPALSGSSSAAPTDTSGPLPLPASTPGGAAAPVNTPVVSSTGAGGKADAGTPADAGAPVDAGKADAAAPADAGASSSKLKACADKCQGVMQSCLTPVFSSDGGFPTIKDPAACKSAADACRAACAP